MPFDVDEHFGKPLKITTTKPRGTASVLTGTASGVHPRALARTTEEFAKLYLTTPRDDTLRGRAYDFVILDEADTLDPKAYQQPLNQENHMSKEEVFPEVQAKLEELAEHMNDYFKATVETELTVTLLAPGSLTVDIPGKGYRKQNHIGGEEFIVDSVRVGAAGKLIFTFKPTAAAGYTKIEMNEVDAAAQLDSFRPIANLAARGNFFEELRQIRAIATQVRQAQEATEKINTYPEFGSW